MSARTLVRRWAGPTAIVMLAILGTGCEDANAPVAHPDSGEADASAVVLNGAGAISAASLNQQLALLRRTTAAFHRVEEAEAAGYTVLVSHPVTGAICLEDPANGGMGRHLLNPALVDDEVAVAEPEVVLYEPQSNGRLRLVGFEYIIPFSIRGPDEAPPTLFGQEFLHNTTFNLWMLHVHAWKHNPSGMFATWNPAINCEHDAAVND